MTRSHIVLLIILAMACQGCASWQDTTRTTLTVIKTAAEAAEQGAMDYFQNRTTTASQEAAAAGCTQELLKVQDPTCQPLLKAFEALATTSKVFQVLYENLRLGLLATTLDDKQNAMIYLEKGQEALKTVYRILKLIAPNAIPTLPVLEVPAIPPASQPVKPSLQFRNMAGR